ncbi:hypothetical protein N7462_006076 [Penicillium macrosclerotiorum]|uniref:uncharacterized protein n=1 Tax=Penicillium macrosclerotiorum TaxID=303699 RepID=UPI0025484A38|nr:uncharacterized protein N7462_006076 [Penicillium macrosclerotiorum]KAJ5682911.1 hypothetical protein N7462_006076 [Penicillium macrosclerotiorum]
MVIGLLVLTAIPTTTGVAFGVSEQRKANQRKEDARRMMKFNIDAQCDGDTDDDRDVHGRRVYLDHPNPTDRAISAFTALAFYIEYPELEETKHLDRGLGLPTYVSANPPLLNWIYADTETHELKYGNRSQSVEHIVGPWDWTEDEKVITLEEKHSFVAVEEEEGEWALYYDRDGDELAAVLEEQGKLDCAFVPVNLVRRIAEEPPPGPQQSQAQNGNSSGGGGQN